jgi:hypothetical protein
MVDPGRSESSADRSLEGRTESPAIHYQVAPIDSC